jgi:hypothetical protein
MNSRNIF